ncbi:MAG: hypothetical protein ACIAQU_07530, partial [Phycisphaerales bacterium JB064]
MRHNDRDPLQPLPQGRLIEGPKPHLIGRTAADEAREVMKVLASATVEAHGALCEKVARQVQAAGVAPERCQWAQSRVDPWERYLLVDGEPVTRIFAQWSGDGTVEFVSQPMKPRLTSVAAHCPSCDSDRVSWTMTHPPACVECGWTKSEEGTDEEPGDGER